jgi:Cys-tRNA(Pro) deacylase
MAKTKTPLTPAIRQLRQAHIEFSEYHYDYQQHGGAPHAANVLGLDLHNVLKTLVFADESNQTWLVLMHGDLEVSGKNLARQLGCKNLAPCTPEVAYKQTGYRIGGISPFGTRKSLPICAEASILGLTRIYINGGKLGFLIGLSPQILNDLLRPTLVSASIQT